MANKIKYGLDQLYFAPITAFDATGAPTYGTPVRIPGAVSISLDPQGDSTPFHADNIVYFVGSANNGYEGDLEVARIPDAFKTAILGFITDGNGAMIEDADAESKHFALLFQFKGDEKATRHVMFNCVATRTNVASSTKTDTVDPQTESITITATSCYNAALGKEIVKAETNSETQATAYNAWFESVYTPTAL